MGKGEVLNHRVWSLFEKAGFETSPSSASTKEFEITLHKKIPVDLYAQDKKLKVSILGSNKSGRRDSWSEHVTFYSSLRDKAKADTVLFVTTGADLEDTERKIIETQGMSVWTGEDLAYYEAL